MKHVHICAAKQLEAAFAYAELSVAEGESIRFLALHETTIDEIEAITQKDKTVVLWADPERFEMTGKGQTVLKAGATMADTDLLGWLRFTTYEVAYECPINPGCFNLVRSRIRPAGGSLGRKLANG